jgi:hypothetical protein
MTRNTLGIGISVERKANLLIASQTARRASNSAIALSSAENVEKSLFLTDVQKIFHFPTK